MKFSEVTGEIRISSDDALMFFKNWFHPNDKVVLVGKRTVKTGNLDVVSQSINAYELVSTLNDGMLETLVFSDDGSSWDLYVGVCPIKDDITLTKRGSESNIDYIPGVYADIDVKNGGFSGEAEILEWLKTLAVYPTIVCGSGSGGVHAYWKLDGTDVADKELIERWWSYLDEAAGTRSIDRLVDLTRILRVPGTVRFPKPGESKLNPVRIIEVSGRTYSLEQLRQVSDEAFEIKKAKKRKTINDDAQRRLNMDYLAQDLIPKTSGNRWELFQAIAYVEDIVNDTYTWMDILPEHGWTHLRELSDGSNEWARPGVDRRSAVTDWEGSPVMSLQSSSEETGLADLKDAGINLSRYRVLLRLEYQDNESALIEDVVMKHIRNEN